MNIAIPPCYKRPLTKWLRAEYSDAFQHFVKRKPSADDIAAYMVLCKIHFRPCVSQTHIVFAVCRNEDAGMIRALKMERAFGKDEKFISDIMELAPKA